MTVNETCLFSCRKFYYKNEHYDYGFYHSIMRNINVYF